MSNNNRGNNKTLKTVENNRGEAKKLFSSYSKAEKLMFQAQKDFIEKKAVASKIAQEVFNTFGKGPFSYKGKMYIPMCRTNKRLKTKTYFMKCPGKKIVVYI